ncbi:MAG TPA: hypothetical protein VHE55_09145 [Fimbriimonadaceae bacterium]|nr:hypothetical protein [Fimbriimonadaceae bacterium]
MHVPVTTFPSTALVVGALLKAADLLKRQGAPSQMENPYREAAVAVSRCSDLVARWLQFGLGGLLQDRRLPAGLALLCSEIFRTGNWSRVRWLQNSDDYRSEIAKAPGIGLALTDRITDSLGAVSLEQLYLLAGGDRLGLIEGFGRHRVPSLLRFLDRALGVGHAEVVPHPIPNPRLMARLDADFLTHIARLRHRGAGLADGFVAHRIVGPWHCSLRTSRHDPSSVMITIDQGDFLFDPYQVRSKPDSGRREVVGIPKTEARVIVDVA